MTSGIPMVIDLASEASTRAAYDNHPVARTNDHVVRISVMTEPYPWHFHPDSDETFLGVEGCLLVEFASGIVELNPGQLVTVPRGTVHRTRPAGARSVNLTVERADGQTVMAAPPEAAANR